MYSRRFLAIATWSQDFQHRPHICSVVETISRIECSYLHPSHVIPNFWHRIHIGFVSSHLTRRILCKKSTRELKRGFSSRNVGQYSLYRSRSHRDYAFLRPYSSSQPKYLPWAYWLIQQNFLSALPTTHLLIRCPFQRYMLVAYCWSMG